jgi:hypothetical protein
MTCSAYIVSTPFNLILATAIAAYVDKSRDKWLLISPHFRDTEKLVDALEGWKGNPFAGIIIVNERWGSAGIVEKIAAIRKGLRGIMKFLDTLPPGGLDAYIFNIEQPEGQLLAYANHIRNGKNTYVEEGIGAYTTRKLDDSFPMKLAKKLLYGQWYRRVDTLLDYPYFNEIMVLRPDLLEIKPKTGARVRKIPNDVFTRLDRDGLVGRMLAVYGVKTLECEVIVLAPNSKLAEAVGYARTLEAYGRILDALARKRIRTVVKYHPREEKGDFLGAGRRKMTMIHPSVTSEMLFLRWKGRNGTRFAIGDGTTALCTCKLIVPDSTALSIMEAIGYKGEKGLKKLFQKWGVLCPKTIEEAVGLVSGRG